MQILIDTLKSKYPVDYSEIEYYRDVFIPMAEKAYEYFANNLFALKGVGESSIYDLIVQHHFNHPLYVHGPEDLHPGTRPSEFGSILICYKGIFLVSADEESYLAFLFHDRDILHDQYIGVHPYWLRDREDLPDLSTQWLDLVEVHALNAASKGMGNLQRYKRVLISGMIKGRECEPTALKKVHNRFTQIYENIFNGWELTPDSISAINSRLDEIYSQYAFESTYIRSLLRMNPSAQKLKL